MAELISGARFILIGSGWPRSGGERGGVVYSPSSPGAEDFWAALKIFISAGRMPTPGSSSPLSWCSEITITGTKERNREGKGER